MAIYRVGDLVYQGRPWSVYRRLGVIVRLSAHGTYCDVLWEEGRLTRDEVLSQIQVIQSVSSDNSEEVVDGQGRGGSTAAVEAGR